MGEGVGGRGGREREWEGEGRKGGRGEGGREGGRVSGREGGMEGGRGEGEGTITEIHTLLCSDNPMPSLSLLRVNHENLRVRCTVLCWYLDKVVSHGDGGAVHQ